jgi:hypothetical protein
LLVSDRGCYHNLPSAFAAVSARLADAYRQAGIYSE